MKDPVKDPMSPRSTLSPPSDGDLAHLDDEVLWRRLRAELCAADALELPTEDRARVSNLARHRLRRRPSGLGTAARALELVAVVVVVLAQLAWAWSVVLS